jgi:anti-anti-sigma regulatory factor/HAMP domain-containing protein
MWLAPFPPPPFISTVDTRITAIVTPLYESQVFRGIFISYISLGSLTSDLIGIQPTQDSWIFVIGPQRELIATSERFLAFLTDQSAPAPSTVLTVTHTLSPELDQIIEQMVEGKQGLEKISLRDRQYLLTYRPILETNWSLALAVPIDELTKSASTVAESIVQTSQDTLRSTVLTTALAVLVAILLGLYFTRRLTKPLGQLATAARAIAHGNYTQEVAVRSRDEIGEVAEAFNLMSHSIVAAQAQLQNANRELEGIVHERTLDLETTISQLQTSLARQNDLDRQLKNASTPLIPVAPGVLLLPLIGSLDTQRMDHAAHAVLHYLQGNPIRDVILDLTGIPDITSEVATALIKLATALGLMGANTMLTGISPEVAETLIALSSDLSGIQTVASLQTAVTIAVQRTAARRT